MNSFGEKCQRWGEVVNLPNKFPVGPPFHYSYENNYCIWFVKIGHIVASIYLNFIAFLYKLFILHKVINFRNSRSSHVDVGFVFELFFVSRIMYKVYISQLYFCIITTTTLRKKNKVLGTEYFIKFHL